jgi:hexulose-6-phosphate isomerase
MKYCFDIDGTLCTNTYGHYEEACPIPAIIEQINTLFRSGHTIILFTARGTTTGIDRRAMTETQLCLWGVLYHKLILGKPDADVYIDDKGMSLAEWEWNLAAGTAGRKSGISRGPAVGIMQGRLSRKTAGQLQTFPHDEWKEEFVRARALGFDRLEWLVDSYALSKNPLGSHEGIPIINRLQMSSGVEVKSLCAHFLIDGALLAHPESAESSQARLVLEKLLKLAQTVGIVSIVVPLLEKASLKDKYKDSHVRENLIRIDKPNGITIAFEMDLNALESLFFLEFMNDCQFRLCYDLGNIHILGYDAIVELPKIINYIDEIHIKDRSFDKSCDLGTGTTPVLEGIRMALELGYQGDFILETPVEPDWAICARRNLNYLSQVLGEAPA